MFSDIAQFSVFGPSVYLYFQFLRKVMILIGILSILSIIPIAFNVVKGTAYSS